MREILSFGLGAPEVCKGSRGFVMAKVWSNTRGGGIATQRYDLGRKTTETDETGLIVADVLSKLARDERQRVIGFSVLKFCGAAKHSASRFERFATFAFIYPNAEVYNVLKIDERDPYNGLCEVMYKYSESVSAILHKVVDFPATSYEHQVQTGLTVVQSAAEQLSPSSLSSYTNVILRPSVVRVEGPAGAA